MMQVQAPDKDDWNKLVHLMKYLRGIRMLPLIHSANVTGILKWWVNAVFTVHPNMQGHSGGGLSLGRGFPIMSLTKQKLNTRSSESEIVGANADQIHSGLAIQDYNLLEVKFDLGAMSLFEEFGNSWFKFDCHLFHLHVHDLESTVKLGVQILFF